VVWTGTEKEINYDISAYDGVGSSLIFLMLTCWERTEGKVKINIKVNHQAKADKK
jgi:hypothetical protein